MFDVYFPAKWNGIKTAIWCLRRNIGKHICWCDANDDFVRISVLSLGTFEPVRWCLSGG